MSQGAAMDMGRIWAGRAGAAPAEPSGVPLEEAFEEAFEEPFEEIVRRHGGMVYGLALRFLGDAAQAEDVAQEAFVRLSENIGRVESGAHPAAWLRRVTARLCVDEYRRRRRGPVPLESIPEPASAEPSADFLALERLRALVAGLPAKVRMALILRYQEDMQPAEIARALGAPLYTVKSRLKRALATLREKMEPVAKRSFATPTELVGCGRNIAGRGFGASRMPRHSTDALSVHLAAPDADGGVEGADVNQGFARGSMGAGDKI